MDYFQMNVSLKNTFNYFGKGDKHNLISPSDATLYFTTNGRSFSKYISIWLHKLVHFIKYPKFFKETCL